MLRDQLIAACLIFGGPASAQEIVAAEYWIDLDLGFGNCTTLVVTPDQELDLEGAINMSGRSPGLHTVGLRTKDGAGHWSLTNITTVLVQEEPPSLEPITQVEYFLNQDPGWGQGDTAWLGSSMDTGELAFTADLDGAVAGINTLFFRSRTTDGRWSLTNNTPIHVEAVDNTVGLIDRIETFWVPGMDPGFGNATQHIVASPSANLIELLFQAPLPVDFQMGDTIAVRTHDSRGIWSLTNFIPASGYTDTDAFAKGTSISVYPNPFTEGITVKTEDGLPVRVVLYDPQGKLVHDKVLTGETRIDLQGLATGAYTAFFWKELERIHRVTLIKQ